MYELTGKSCIRKMFAPILITHILFLALGIAHAAAKPLELTITNTNCDLQPNKYIKKCEGWAENGAAFLKFEFSDEDVSGLEILYSITLGEGQVPEQRMIFCDAVADETIQKKFLTRMEPEGTFPKHCSNWKANSYNFNDYRPEGEDIPPYSTNGEVTAEIYIFDPEGEQIALITGAGELKSIVSPVSAPL